MTGRPGVPQFMGLQTESDTTEQLNNNNNPQFQLKRKKKRIGP